MTKLEILRRFAPEDDIKRILHIPSGLIFNSVYTRIIVPTGVKEVD